MNHELAQPEDRVTFLSDFFDGTFDAVSQEWREVEVPLALWRVTALYDGSRKVIACRISAGDVDSFCLDLDNPDNFEHLTTTREATMTKVCESAEAQYEMGLTRPNEEDIEMFDELVSALMTLS